MSRSTRLALIAALTGAPMSAQAAPVDAFHQGHTTYPDSHAPIGVMGDHQHKTGEWMLSYRYMRMNMEGNRDGSERLTPAEVLSQGFMATPLKMTMEMHMLGAMYGLNDNVTLMFMMPWVEKTMDHLTGMGGRFTARTNGIGDFSISAITRLGDVGRNHTQVLLTTGVSLPTGSIDKKDRTTGAAEVRLPYPMQLGSGTYDLLLGLTATGRKDTWSWGRQVKGTIRFDDNEEGYRLGDRVSASLWAAKNMSDVHSLSLRLNGDVWRNIEGEDALLNPNMISTADPDRRAGKQLDVAVGFNYLGKAGLLEGQRFALEVSVPAYQKLEGPQLETDQTITAGWQHAWH